MPKKKKKKKLVDKKIELKRSLGVGLSTTFAVGLIMGAAIYGLIGDATRAAGGLVWLPFAVMPAILYLLIGLTYAELASTFPKAASAYVYAKEGLSTVSKGAGRFIPFVLLFNGLFVAIPLTAAVVALVFGQFLNVVLGLPALLLGGVVTIQPEVIIGVLLVLFLTVLNWFGIKESALAMVVAMLIEAGGLVVLTIVGFTMGTVNVDYLSSTGAPEGGLMGLVTAFMFGYFMYTGFELIPALADEAKQPEKTIPRAIILSLIIVTILYVGVSMALPRLIPLSSMPSTEDPAASPAIVVAAVAVMGGAGALLFGFFGLFAGLNTVLAALVTSSRLMYGIAREGGLPSPLAQVGGRRRTPTNAIVIAMLVSAGYCLLNIFFSVTEIAASAVVTICMIDLIVCTSLILIRRRTPRLKRPFRVPLSVKRVPIPTLLAAIMVVALSVVLLLYNWITWVPFLVSIPIAAIVYKVIHRKRE